MLNMKTILTAASLAVLSAAGIGSAAASPWHHDRFERRDAVRQERVEHRFEHRAFVERVRIADTLRFHRYRMIGDPTFIHGRYVVRTHDRFGRTVFVQVDPYSGAFVREIHL